MKRYIMAICLACFCLPVFSSEKDVVGQILGNNKNLQAAKSKMDADIYGLKSENNLQNPEVEMSYLFTKPDPSIELSVTESFEFPGVYSARRKYNKHAITAFQYIYLEEYVALSQQARTMLCDLVNANKRIKLIKRILSEEEQLLALYNKNLSESNFTILEVNKLKLEILDNKSVFKDLNVQKNSILRDLQVLNGGIGIAGLDLDVADYGTDEPHEFGTYLDDYLNYSPELKVAEQQRLSMEQGVNVAKWSNLPELTVGYSYKNEDGERGHGFVLGVSIPIFANRHKKNAAKAELLANTFSEQNTVLGADAKIRSLYDSMHSQKEKIEDYGAIVDNPEYYSILRKSLDAGQITLRDYIIELRDLSAASEKLYEMEYDYNVKFVELSKYEILKNNDLFPQ